MDFKSLLSQLDQLNEATEKTKTGIKHTAEPGGYGRKDDEDEEGNKVKDTSAEKKGRGRPKKATSASGETKKYDFSAFGATGKDIKLPKYDKKKTTKHSLKEYFDAIDQEMIAEAEQIQIKPASQMPKVPGQSSIGQKPAVPGQAPSQQKNTQVIAQGNKTLGTVDNPQLAQQIKQSIGKGEMTLMPNDEMAEGTVSDHPEHQAKIQQQFARVPGLMDVWKKYKHLSNYGTSLPANMTALKKEFPNMDRKTMQSIANSLILDNDPYSPNSGDAAFYAAKEIKDYLDNTQHKSTGIMQKAKNALGGMFKEDEGKHNNATTGFDALVRKLTPKYGVEAAKRIAGAQLKKIREADQPPNDSLMSPIGESRTKADDKAEKAGKKVTKDLEYDMGHKSKDDNKAEKAGKKVTKDIEYDEKKKTVKEAAKPDFLDLDKDGNKKESMKKAATDKKKVKEGMEHRLKAARHRGKAHALAKESYNCKYDDMEEARHYHEGFKEGLDECYGQMPIQGYVGETTPAATVPGMASQAMPAMEADMDEGNAFTGKLKDTPQGSKFTLGGKTFKDTSSLEESPFAFESLDKQLNALLEGEEVTEGMTVSISKGQQGMPDSVSVNAQDAEADQLLSIIKQAGLGLFGGDDAGQPQATQPMTVDVDGGEGPEAEIEVVDDHDDMLSLIRKMTGQGPSAGDYEEEGGSEPAHTHEEATCESCGCEMNEGHSCGEAVEEDETMDQREYEVAEEINPNNNDEAEEEETDATRDAALAQAADNNEKQVDEGGDGGEASDAGNIGVEIADVADETEEDLDESYANSDDDQFETDIDFMTKVISGGLNKQKSTGQTTIPVIAGQNDRMGYNTNESVNDWKKLAGIK